MEISSIAVQQREKESKSLRAFLTYSLLGSLVLHIGVLSAGIGDFFHKEFELNEEPLEVVIVDPPKLEVVKPQPQPQVQRTEPQPPVRQSVVSPGSSRSSQPRVPQNVEVVRTSSSPPKAAASTPSRPEPRVAPAPAPERPPQPVESLRQESAPVIAAPSTTVPNQQLRSTLGEVRTARESQATAPVNSGNNTNTAVVGNTPARTGQNSGTPVAAGPRTVRQGTPQGRGRGEGDAEGTGSGRLACRNCNKPKYPESARKRGVEGAAKVAVDVDKKGNVTNVRVTQSSGDAELDEAAARAARKWKFDTPNGARQGVVAKVDFALEGSERHRQVQEREKRKKLRRKRQAETATQTKQPVAASSAPRRSEASAPRRQRQSSQSSSRQQAAPGSQSKLRQALRRQEPSSNSSSSSSQGNLRESLRQSGNNSQ